MSGSTAAVTALVARATTRQCRARSANISSVRALSTARQPHKLSSTSTLARTASCKAHAAGSSAAAHIVARRLLSNKPKPEEIAAREPRKLRALDDDLLREDEEEEIEEDEDIEEDDSGSSDEEDSSSDEEDSSSDEEDDGEDALNEAELSKLLNEQAPAAVPKPTSRGGAPVQIKPLDLIQDPFCLGCGGAHWTFECDHRSFDDWPEWQPAEVPNDVVDKVLKTVRERGVHVDFHQARLLKESTLSKKGNATQSLNIPDFKARE